MVKSRAIPLTSDLEARCFLLLGLVLIGAGAAANEYVLASILSADGTLEPSSRLAIWLFDLCLFVAGSTFVGFRRSPRLRAILDLAERALTAPASYAAFAVGLLVYALVGLVSLYGGVGSDYWTHLAAVFSMTRDLLHPEHPLFNVSSPTHLHTPYHLSWAALSRLVNVHPFVLFPLAGIINLFLFVVGVSLAARYLIGHRKYALALLLAMLFLWISPPPFAGYYNFGLLPLTSVYPYWFSFAVSLIVISLAGEPAYRTRPWWAIFAGSVTVVVLSHSITGSFLLVALALKSLSVTMSIKDRAQLLAIPVAGVLLAFFWPYYPLFSFAAGSGEFRKWGLGGTSIDLFYDRFLLHIAPAFLGLLFVLRPARAKRSTFVMVAALTFFAVFIGNRLAAGNIVMARHIVFVAAFLHLGVALTLLVFEDTALRRIVVTLFGLIVIVAAGFEIRASLTQVGLLRDLEVGAPLGYHSNWRVFRRYQRFTAALRSNDVVLADTRTSSILPGVVGCKVVTGQPDPFTYDFFARRRDVERFFDPRATAGERVSMLEKYGVTHVLVSKTQWPMVADLPGQVTYLEDAGDLVLLRVWPARPFESRSRFCVPSATGICHRPS